MPQPARHCLHLPLLSWAHACLLAAGLACSFTEPAIAAELPSQLTFQNVVENKDIALGEGASFLQDREGFMWLGGGSALVRYDGYDFKQIDVSLSTDPNDKVPVKFTETLFEDSHGTIWVGSRGGLLKYDPRKETLTKVADDPNQPLKLTESQILRFGELPSGEIIGCGMEAIYIVDRRTGKYSLILPDAKNPAGLKGPRTSALYIENATTIWFATNAGLEKLDWTTKTFSFYPINSDYPASALDGRATDIVADGAGKLWLSTGHGLVHYDPSTRQGKRYLNDPADKFSLGNNDIWKLLMDSRGLLWIATDGGGVSLFDPTSKRFVSHKFEQGRAGSLNTNVARTLFEDKAGDIWVGNYPNGVNMWDRSSAAIQTYASDAANPNSLSASRVTSVGEDKNGNLWIGTGGAGGVNFWNRQTGEFTRYKSDPKDPNTLSGNSIHDTYVDPAGIVWIGTHSGGLNSFDPATQKFTRLPLDPERKGIQEVSHSSSLNAATVWTIKEDSQQNLWLSTHSGGLSRYRRDTQQFTHYVHVVDKPDSIADNLVWTTLEDSSGNFWVCTSKGLNLMDREKGTFKTFAADPSNPKALSDNNVISILEDRKKRIWVGTEIGLNLFDPVTHEFTVFTKKSGFANHYIRSIFEDRNGLLWVGTDNGFSSFNPDTHAIKNYMRLNGRLIGDFAYRSGIISQRGEVILGGTNGMRIINTAALTENTLEPPIAFTDLKLIAGRAVPDGADGVLKSAINHSEKLVLDHTQPLFAFEFAALNFRNPSDNQYAYKLEGFDTTWVMAGNQHAAKYTNLDSGTYAFRVSASNNDGLWNKTGKTLTVVVLPPPWKTWWAYTLYALALCAIIVSFVNSQLRKRRFVEEQNRLLEIKVSERTNEVLAKSRDIQLMLENIPQGLFTFDPSGKVHPEYSSHLESIFAATHLAGRQALDLLFAGASVSSNDLDQVKEAVFSILGEDEINYFVNEHLLLPEYSMVTNGQLQYLSLDWAPVVVDGVVAKLMVSVRDVTQLKRMEQEASLKKRELDIISQLLNIPAKKYRQFAESTQRFIDENRAQICVHTQRDNECLAMLFRNMHTIKGNCRVFGFDHFSNVVHEIESTYSTLVNSPEAQWEQEQLLTELQQVEDQLHEYEAVYFGVLGRDDTAQNGRDPNGAWADSQTLAAVAQNLAWVDHTSPAEAVSASATVVRQWLQNALSLTLSVILKDVVASLAGIAEQLEKPSPQVIINDGDVRINPAAAELLTHIFGHMFRNAIDHGIGPPQLRLQAGKPAAGCIQVGAQRHGNGLHLTVKDDGRGLNIGKLFSSGVTQGLWLASDQPPFHDIAQLIFLSGVSTINEVTSVSGRGVGMDAVKAFLVAQQGDITLRLLGDDANGRYTGQDIWVPFELVIELPAQVLAVIA